MQVITLLEKIATQDLAYKNSYYMQTLQTTTVKFDCSASAAQTYRYTRSIIYTLAVANYSGIKSYVSVHIS